MLACELTIWMEIDQPARFTRRVMNFQQLFCPGKDWRIQIISPQHIPDHCVSFSSRLHPTLYHCLQKKKRGHHQEWSLPLDLSPEVWGMRVWLSEVKFLDVFTDHVDQGLVVVIFS